MEFASKTITNSDLDKYLFEPSVDLEEHILATYYLESHSSDMYECARALAIGQSIGNPNVRNDYENELVFKRNLAKILDKDTNLRSRKRAEVTIAFPLANLDIPQEGITQVLVSLMGGQMDIDIIEKCSLMDIRLPKKYLSHFKGPKYGIHEIKARCKAKDRPLLGGIVKPKIGISKEKVNDIVLQMLRGGVDFIKEDEILGNPDSCPFEERVELVSGTVNDFCQDEGREVFYTPCINADYPYFAERAKFAEKHGVRAVHINFWAGLSAYRYLRNLDLKLALFFQKSGDKIMTARGNDYNISWKVICKLARIMGADFIHAGMWGGYLSDSKMDLLEILNVLKGPSEFKPVVSSLSCGSHPGLAHSTIYNFGNDLMMNAGGAITGHPMGIEAGARAFRQAFDGVLNNESLESLKSKPEFAAAVNKWGYVKP
jgi:ribulose 1,5-bisphosphate carboxylase large subunit-like protein